MNCKRSEQHERLREAFTGIRAIQGPEYFIFSELNMHNFKLFLVQIREIYDFWWSQA